MGKIPPYPTSKKVSNKIVCIDARAEPLLEEGKEYEIEKFDQYNRHYLIKDLPHHRDPKRFRREDGIDLEVFEDLQEMDGLISDYNETARELDNQEEQIKSKIKKITEKYGKPHKEYREAVCKEQCHDVSIYR